jgi:MFS family permease
MNALVARLGNRYAWVVGGAAFVALLASAGARSMPGALLVPIENDLHWSRATISLAVGIGIALYGLVGPFAAALMQRFGVRKTIGAALVLVSISLALNTFVVAPWQMFLTWGVLSGLGTGTASLVLAATIVGRWFRANRGLAMGLLTASTQTGQLIFLPVLAATAEYSGWRMASLIVAGVALLVAIPFLLLVPERPADVGLAPYGSDVIEPDQGLKGNPLATAFEALGRGIRTSRFWILGGAFFICGLSSNGLIGTHMIALCQDHGIPEVQAAGLVASMGLFDLVGTALAGWMSDRYNNWALLAAFYGFRGLALMFLPFSDFGFLELSGFAIIYGLDWIATVPPTIRLITQKFGDRDGPILFGWIMALHQLGAATAAYGAGLLRTEFNSYMQAVIIAAIACLIASMIMLASMAGKSPRPVPA